MTERVVIKVGGATLFQIDGFEAELRSLLANYQNAQVLLVVGGGDLVESMRTAHKIYHRLDPVIMHWRCVELLDHTWEIAKELFPCDNPIEKQEELDRLQSLHAKIGIHWVRVQSFYSQSKLEHIPTSLRPASNWNTTTDTLAWLLAKIIDADRVVLIKQCYCDPSWSLDQAAKLGVIDSELARLAAQNKNPNPIIEFAKATLSSGDRPV